jgi:hypothetical protein
LVAYIEGGMYAENRVRRRIFWPKRGKVKGEWKSLHNKELYALYFSPNISLMIKPRILRWAGHIACMGDSLFVMNCDCLLLL